MNASPNGSGPAASASARWILALAGTKTDHRSRLKEYLPAGSCPELLSFARHALQNDPVLARLLLDSSVVLRAIVDPRISTREEAFALAVAAKEFDRTVDMRLLEYVAVQGGSAAIREEHVLRGLDVLEHIQATERAVMTLVRLSADRRPKVHSKALKLLGTINMSATWVTKALADMDPRARANLLDGLLAQRERPSDKALIQVVRTATGDPHHRVATTALCLLVRAGDFESLYELQRLLNHPDERWRRAAEWAVGLIREKRWAFLGIGRFRSAPPRARSEQQPTDLPG